eukprot:1092264-Rhodomonas_salina.1
MLVEAWEWEVTDDALLLLCVWQSGNGLGDGFAAQLAEALPMLPQLAELELVCAETEAGRGEE